LSDRDIQRDSWLDLPTVSAPFLPDVHLSEIGSTDPNQALNTSDESEQQVGELPTLTSQRSKNQHLQQIADSPDDLLTEQLDQDLASVFALLDAELQTERSPLPASTPARPSAPSSILPSSLQLDRPPESSIPASFQAEASPPGVEFLFHDRRQARREFWFTITPLLVKGVALVIFLLLFMWLWMGLKLGHFAVQNLRISLFSQNILSQTSDWRVSSLKHQWRIVGKQHLLIVSGKLKNTRDRERLEPDLELRIYTASGKLHSAKNLRCCLTISPQAIANIGQSHQISDLLSQSKSKQRRMLPSGKDIPFQIVWLASDSVRYIEVQAHL
jgi:hypothetical protein